MRKYMKIIKNGMQPIAGKIKISPSSETVKNFQSVHDRSYAYSLSDLVSNYLSPRRTWEAGIDLCVYLCFRFCGFYPFFVRKSMPLGLMRNGILNPCFDRDSPGQSMPSRHVFSASIISMACLHASLSVGLSCWSC